MAEALPKFDAPPVVETALGIQFARLSGYSTALAGWFWKSYLARSPRGEEWVKAVEAARLEDQFEQFGQEQWAQPGMKLGPGGEPQRTQIIRADEERMLQLQDSRIVLNWRKKTGGYPSYPVLVEEFLGLFQVFERFVADAAIGPIEPNQWEVTYVNHVPKGEMWESPRDWQKIVPTAAFPSAVGPDAVSETMSSDWRFSLGGNRAHLYVGLRHAKIHPSDEQVMLLTLTARGPVDQEAGKSITQGFELGHEAIVRTFTSMTSTEAHKHWRRKV